MWIDFNIDSDDHENECPSDPSMALAHHILNKIVNTIYRIGGNGRIDSFEIVPVEINQKNTSPVLHVDGNLGVESWCVKYVYNYAYSKMKIYLSKNKRKRISPSNYKIVNCLLTGALLFNPDVMTFWNLRREMLIKEFLRYEDEFQFSSIVLSHKPKCNEAFSYRRWLMKRICTGNVAFNDVLSYANVEINLAEMCARKCSNNYHAWSHRIWVMTFVSELLNEYSLSMEYTHDNEINANMMYFTELRNSEMWITRNVSDHSGFHYRQFCFEKVFKTDDLINKIFRRGGICLDISITESCHLQERLKKFVLDNLPITDLFSEIKTDQHFMQMILDQNAKIDLEKYPDAYQNLTILTNELRINEDSLFRYDTRETLWCHRRYIMDQIMTALHVFFGKNKLKGDASFDLNEMYDKTDTSLNITKALLGKYDHLNGNATMGSVNESKILKWDNHTVYDNLFCYALSANEKRIIQKKNKFVTCLLSQNYDMWLKFILKFPQK